MNSRDVAFAGLFAALTAVGAQISIPIGPVPLTLQVFTVLLSGLILGSRLGFLSQAVYLFMGVVGIPVFANVQGGLAVIYGPTGGYLVAFPLAAFLAGYVAERKDSLAAMVAGSVIAIAVIYALGWLRLGLLMGNDFKKAFFIGVLPFIPADLGKALVAAAVAKTVKKWGVL
ncbi:biotin transporter BioY [Thermococcus sp. M36]|uniref:biotin transporter BioY n=1 Tax=Thermococcus sp. M36 TaxID=1638261 RepID=UPI0014391068|nr:biotin transporter BioY [Thermococcus sp. M36]NJE05115.1 biotin transporter BioY [Thermococcus sp. M36]